MYLSEVVQQQLCQEARESAPREVCGFVLKTGELHPMENVNPEDREWSMDRDASVHFRMNNLRRIAGTYHSHPGGRIEPSLRDMEGCPPSYFMWIVTLTEVWRWMRHGDSWVGVYEPTFSAAVVSRGADGFRPQSTSVAHLSGRGRILDFVPASRVDELGPSNPTLSDRIRAEADS